MNFEYKNINLINDKIEELPTLPTIAIQLLDLLGSSSASMTQISRVMQIDPSITAKVLKIANSAYYSLRKKVDNIRMALVVLGISEVRNIILSLSLFSTFSDKERKDNEFDQRIFWHHSAIVAHLTKFLARKFDVKTHGEEFTGGLLHDIGKIIINEFLNEKHKKIIDIMSEKSCMEYVAEKRVLGWSHFQIGAFLANEWKIPTSLIDVILYHHFPSESGNNDICYLVNIADYLAHNFSLRQSYQNYDITSALDLSLDYFRDKGFEVSIDELSEEIEQQIENANSFFISAFGLK